MLLVVALAAIAGSTAPTADAYRSPTNPATVELNWPSTVGKLRLAGDFFACETAGTCTQAQKDAIAKARRLGAYLPKLRHLGTLSLATTAFSLGWKIGRVIDTKFLQLSGSIGTEMPSGSFSNESWQFSAGSDVWSIGPHWTLVFGSPGFGGGTIPGTSSGGFCEGSTNGCGSGSFPGGALGAKAYGEEMARLIGLYPSASVLRTDVAGIAGTDQNCGAPAEGSCLALVVPEASLESDVGANAHPVPYVAQPFGATSNIPAPVDPTFGSPEGVALREALLEDEATAQGAPGTSTETGTMAHEAGENADPLNENTNPGTGTVDPGDDWEGYSYPEFEMPNCTGLTQAACTALLEADGWVGTATVVELGRQGAVVTFGPGAVVDTTPAPGVAITTETPVEFETNPDPLPLVLPSPTAGETYTAYLERLRALGWLGTATVTVVSEPSAVPELGPNAPVTVETPVTTTTTTVQRVGAPWGDPRVFPDEPIGFTINPPNLPTVPTTGQPIIPFLPPEVGGPDECECPIEPLDFSPLAVDHVCDKFPFGALCWIGDQVDLFGGGPIAPHVTFTHGAITTQLYTLPADSFRFDLDAAGTPAAITEWFPVIRNALGFSVWLIGLWLLGRRMLGINTPDATGATDGTWDESAGKYGGSYR